VDSLPVADTPRHPALDAGDWFTAHPMGWTRGRL